MSKSRTVGFRLDISQYRDLEKLAAQHGKSASSYARDLVRQYLDGQGTNLLDEIRSIKNEIASLQGKLQGSVGAILLSTGTTRDRVEAFLKENF